MNTLIQNILVFTALGIAIVFLVKKFMPKKAVSKKACDSDNDCACH